MPKNSLAALALSFLLIIPVTAQIPNPDDIVSVSSEIGKISDDSYLLKVFLHIKDDWHINSDKPLEDFFIPTTVTLDSLDQSEYKIKFSKALVKKFGFSENELSVFEGTVTLRIKLTPNQAKILTGGVVGYQACNDKVCLMPVEKKFKITGD